MRASETKNSLHCPDSSASKAGRLEKTTKPNWLIKLELRKGVLKPQYAAGHLCSPYRRPVLFYSRQDQGAVQGSSHSSSNDTLVSNKQVPWCPPAPLLGRIHAYNSTACTLLDLVSLKKNDGSQHLTHAPGKLLARLHKTAIHSALLTLGLKIQHLKGRALGQTTCHGKTGEIFQHNQNSSGICYFFPLFLK